MVRRKQNEGFNNPFFDIRKKIERTRKSKEAKPADEKLRRDIPKELPTPPASHPGPGATPQSSRDEEVGADSPGEDRLFLEAVADIAQLSERGKRRMRRVRRTEIPPGTTAQDEDSEVLAALSDLVAGEGEFNISDTDEYIEGIAPGIDRRLLKRLKRGDFSVQAHLDLHGMVKEQAKVAVGAFVRSARHADRRCVIIVHGRGLRSPGGEPVLKKAVAKWLSRGPLGRQVLAFASTLSHDGGTGAMYVLLRR